MTVFTLETEQWIARTPEELFGFFGDATNLEQLTPPWLHFHIESLPDEMHKGARIQYRLRLHGIPLHWHSEITAWEPPLRFVDTQIRGPYRSWVHEHRFECLDGGTLMRDRVTYAVSGGALIHRFLVAPDLERIFQFRKSRLNSIFGGSHE
jgi:ligand-binding SRPBCC domain-containing protein